MIPKLSPLQWLIAVLLLVFYGFAVFALTRDYYLRHPLPSVATAPPVPHALPDEGVGDWVRDALGESAGGLPEAVLSSDPVLLAQEADRLFAERRFDAAIARYRRALELNADDQDSRNDLGLALFYAGRADEALTQLQAGAAAAPAFQRIWLSLGFVASRSGEESLAREALTRASTLDPDSEVGAEAKRMLQELGAP